MVLNFLKKILPPEVDTFYSLFEEGAEICHETSELFHKIAAHSINEEKSREIRHLKTRSNTVAKKTLSLISATFVTPLERENIQEVACLLNKITKKIVKASLGIEVYRLEAHTENMQKQAAALLQATSELKYNVSLLRNISATKEIANVYNKMKEIESRGDEILFEAMDDIFSGKYDALTVIKLRELHKNIENALNSCLDVSDLVLNIALKNG